MKTIHLIGSSHARRIGFALLKNPKILRKYDIKSLAKSGAKYSQLQYPSLSQIRSCDVVIFQAFGNDLLKSPYKFENGFYHLLSFDPTPLDELEKMFQKFFEWCSKLSCKVYLVGFIPRFYHCCELHKFPGLISHQVKANRLLAKLAKKVQNVVFVNSLKALGIPRKNWNSSSNKMLSDNVHLKLEGYKQLAEYLFKIFEK